MTDIQFLTKLGIDFFRVLLDTQSITFSQESCLKFSRFRV